MEDKKRFAGVRQRSLRNPAVRVRRQMLRRRIRGVPSIPGVLRFIGDIAAETPLVPLLLTLLGFWLLFSWGLYAVEHNSNEQLSSYGSALWWSFTAMQTQGANAPGPTTSVGMTIGAVWSILSTVAFFGVVIGVLYSYYMRPRRSGQREIVRAIQYNLEELDSLSVDELEALKETVARLLDARVTRLEEES